MFEDSQSLLLALELSAADGQLEGKRRRERDQGKEIYQGKMVAGRNREPDHGPQERLSVASQQHLSGGSPGQRKMVVPLS